MARKYTVVSKNYPNPVKLHEPVPETKRTLLPPAETLPYNTFDKGWYSNAREVHTNKVRRKLG